MLFLAIETSCDETSAAVFTDEPRVLSNVVASQTELHTPFGGVVPEIAARAHLQKILPVVEEALNRAGVDMLSLSTGDDMVRAIVRFAALREQRRR